ncbi:hypothetical protein [Pedobacter sp. B4-66]|uniref:hypothetical protein n=1 Tax=Pedobacter sp. B4-66 TaxID=2817280 RepID=UPI001BDB108E|nr:hypothetical protein [Pedobacter sp. B4-66]
MREKKILILTESIDITADKVCGWLVHLDQDFVRFNTDKEAVWIDEITMKGTQVDISIGHVSGKYKLHDFKNIWFRRGQFINTIRGASNNIYPNDEIINDQINDHLHREIKTLNEFVYSQIPHLVPQINNPVKYNINKLECLYRASKLGMLTPDTYITSKKDRINELRKHEALITKNIGDVLTCHTDNFFMMQSTTLVVDKYVSRVKNSFFPSLFQSAIKKKADVRVFFILNRIFTTIVFDFAETNLIDFRESKNMAILPFQLPQIEETKLLELAREMGLESGSADYVLSENDELYFLEINPVGQIDFISQLANLYIEKEIAKTLIEYGTSNS